MKELTGFWVSMCGHLDLADHEKQVLLDHKAPCLTCKRDQNYTLRASANIRSAWERELA